MSFTEMIVYSTDIQPLSQSFTLISGEGTEVEAWEEGGLDIELQAIECTLGTVTDYRRSPSYRNFIASYH